MEEHRISSWIIVNQQEEVLDSLIESNRRSTIVEIIYEELNKNEVHVSRITISRVLQSLNREVP